jgi:hypothetical protein
VSQRAFWSNLACAIQLTLLVISVGRARGRNRFRTPLQICSLNLQGNSVAQAASAELFLCHVCPWWHGHVTLRQIRSSSQALFAPVCLYHRPSRLSVDEGILQCRTALPTRLSSVAGGLSTPHCTDHAVLAIFNSSLMNFRLRDLRYSPPRCIKLRWVAGLAFRLHT